MKTIAIFGVPRSGTSWLGQIFNSSPMVAYRYQPLFSFAFKDRLNPHSSAQDVASFYTELLNTKDDFVLQKRNVSGSDEVQFSKSEKCTHMVWKEVRYLHIIENLLAASETKIIGIVRHPCAVINSWLRAPKEFKSDWNPDQEWKSAPKKNAGKPEEYNGYVKWKEIAFLYSDLLKRYPDRFRLILYESLLQQTNLEMKRLFDFVGLEFGSQTEDFILKSMSTGSDDPYGVLRQSQEPDKWKTELAPAIREGILEDDDFRKLNQYYQWENYNS